MKADKGGPQIRKRYKERENRGQRTDGCLDKRDWLSQKVMKADKGGPQIQKKIRRENRGQMDVQIREIGRVR